MIHNYIILSIRSVTCLFQKRAPSKPVPPSASTPTLNKQSNNHSPLPSALVNGTTENNNHVTSFVANKTNGLRIKLTVRKLLYLFYFCWLCTLLKSSICEGRLGFLIQDFCVNIEIELIMLYWSIACPFIKIFRWKIAFFRKVI